MLFMKCALIILITIYKTENIHTSGCIKVVTEMTVHSDKKRFAPTSRGINFKGNLTILSSDDLKENEILSKERSCQPNNNSQCHVEIRCCMKNNRTVECRNDGYSYLINLGNNYINQQQLNDAIKFIYKFTKSLKHYENDDTNTINDLFLQSNFIGNVYKNDFPETYTKNNQHDFDLNNKQAGIYNETPYLTSINTIKYPKCIKQHKQRKSVECIIVHDKNRSRRNIHEHSPLNASHVFINPNLILLCELVDGNRPVNFKILLNSDHYGTRSAGYGLNVNDNLEKFNSDYSILKMKKNDSSKTWPKLRKRNCNRVHNKKIKYQNITSNLISQQHKANKTINQQRNETNHKAVNLKHNTTRLLRHRKRKKSHEKIANRKKRKHNLHKETLNKELDDYEIPSTVKLLPELKTFTEIKHENLKNDNSELTTQSVILFNHETGEFSNERRLHHAHDEEDDDLGSDYTNKNQSKYNKRKLMPSSKPVIPPKTHNYTMKKTDKIIIKTKVHYRTSFNQNYVISTKNCFSHKIFNTENNNKEITTEDIFRNKTHKHHKKNENDKNKTKMKPYEEILNRWGKPDNKKKSNTNTTKPTFSTIALQDFIKTIKHSNSATTSTFKSHKRTTHEISSRADHSTKKDKSNKFAVTSLNEDKQHAKKQKTKIYQNTEYDNSLFYSEPTVDMHNNSLRIITTQKPAKKYYSAKYDNEEQTSTVNHTVKIKTKHKHKTHVYHTKRQSTIIEEDLTNKNKVK